MLVVHEM